MTVIATLVSRECIAHAADSFLTQMRPNGTLRLIQSQARKLLPVPRCRGALAFYGFAGDMQGWTTLAWLRRFVSRTTTSKPDEFAEALATELQAELKRLGFHNRKGFGVGIHFGAFERVESYWIPEMFHISNWQDVSYSHLRPSGVGASRDSYVTMFPGAPRKDLQSERLDFRLALSEGRFLQFNNGNPTLFNPVASAFQGMVRTVGKKGRKPVDAEFWRALAQRPVQAVADVARDFLKPEYRMVGGRVRDLVLTPDGRCSSKSGDA